MQAIIKYTRFKIMYVWYSCISYQKHFFLFSKTNTCIQYLEFSQLDVLDRLKEVSSMTIHFHLPTQQKLWSEIFSSIFVHYPFLEE